MEKLYEQPQSNYEQPSLDQALIEQPQISASEGKDGQTRFHIHGVGVDGKRTSRFMKRDEVNEAFAGFSEPTQTTETEDEATDYVPKHKQYEPKHMSAEELVDSTDAVPKHLKKEEDDFDTLPQFLKDSFVKKPVELPKEQKSFREIIGAEPEEDIIKEFDEKGNDFINNLETSTRVRTQEDVNEVNTEAKKTVLRARNEEFWAEADSQKRLFGRVRERATNIPKRLRAALNGAAVMIGLAEDSSRSPSIEAPNRRTASPEEQAANAAAIEAVQKETEKAKPKHFGRKAA